MSTLSEKNFIFVGTGGLRGAKQQTRQPLCRFTGRLPGLGYKSVIRFSGSVQLCAGGDVRIHHQQVQALAAVLLVDSGDQHTLGINAHHLAGGQQWSA